MLNDPLANVLSNIHNASRTGKAECSANPASKIVMRVLEIMKEHKYVGEYKIVDERQGGLLHITLIGSLNKCGVIKPRFSVTLDTYEKFEKRYLPARGFGFIVVSTSQGIMTHEEAKEKGIGGKLLAYVY